MKMVQFYITLPASYTARRFIWANARQGGPATMANNVMNHIHKIHLILNAAAIPVNRLNLALPGKPMYEDKM